MILDFLPNVSGESVGPMRSACLGPDERRPAGADRADTVPLHHDLVTHRFNADSLCAEDLVFLYQNVGAEVQQSASGTNDRRRERNQLVETVVYDGDSDVSYGSESISFEDLHDLLLVNDEQFEIFECGRSDENQLCHKFSELAIRLSNLSMSNGRQHSFKCPCRKKRLESIRSSPYFNSLRAVNRDEPIDYIRKECFDGNYYNIYMENVIKFVNHTLDQLKKISNGEYLSPKAKAKWCKADGRTSDLDADASTTVASLPVRIETEPRPSDQLSKWEESVHSEIDIRSLTKMLENKVVVEIPKMIYDSVRLFEKYKNALTSDPREQERATTMNSHLDFLFRCKRSGAATVINEFSSILLIQTNHSPNENIIVKKLLPITFEEATSNESTFNTELLSTIYVGDSKDDVITVNKPVSIDHKHKLLPAILYKPPAITSEEKIPNESITPYGSIVTTHKEDLITPDAMELLQPISLEDSNKTTKTSRIIELSVESDQNENSPKGKTTSLENCDIASMSTSSSEIRNELIKSPMNSIEEIIKDYESNSSDGISVRDKTPRGVSYPSSEDDDTVPAEMFNLATPDFNMQPDYLKKTPLPIEGNPEKVNMHQTKTQLCNDVKNKSPDDSSIFLMAGKREKRFNENRQRRERSKALISEACGSAEDGEKEKKRAAPQASRSVTKLSVSNKSFYNSIYGNTKTYSGRNDEIKTYGGLKKVTKPLQLSKGQDFQNEIVDGFFENCNIRLNTDTAISEMTYVQMSKENSTDVSGKNLVSFSSTTSASVLSGNNMSDNLHILPPLSESPRENGINDKGEFHSLFKTAKNFDEKESSYVNESMMPTNIFHFVHNDTPKGNGTSDVRPSSIKRALPQECRRSIDKIYNLMNEMVNSNKAEIEDGRTNRTGDNETQPAEKRSDRNKSVSKSSDVDELMTSNFCINKVNRGNNKRNEISVSTVPQPDANFKSSRARLDVHEKNKFSFKEVKSNNLDNVNHDTAFRAVSRARRTSDGGARGQNMKRTHVAADRRASDYITYNKLTDSRRYHRSDYTRPSRAERRERERELWCNRNESISPRKKCVKLSQIENTKVAIGGDNTFDNYVKRNIADVIDEAKEARGEAVRGPPKLNATRLDALAQPRRPYVQAHSEYYRRRHGRTLVADRLQRLAAPAHPSVPNASPSRNYTHVDTPAKIPKKLNKGKSTIVRARTRSSSPEAQSPTPSPSTRNKYAERPLRWKPTQLTSRQPEVEMTTLGSPRKFQRLSQNDCLKVKFQNTKRFPLQKIPSDDSFESEQKFITEEPSAVDESLNDNSDSNNDLLKACEDSAEKLFTMCHEYKEENEIENATYVITTQYTANNNLSAEFSEISNLTNTDNSNTNVTTDLSIDQRKLEDKFDTRLNLIRKFNKQIQNNSDEVDLVNVGVQDRILYNAFQETVKFNEESENCPNRSNQILIVKSGNPVRSIDPEAELELLLVLDVLPRILKTHLDFKLPDLPIQIATVNYAISQYNNVECITSNYDKYHKRIDLTRQITDERLTESRSAEVIGNIQNHQNKKSVLTYQCSSSNCNDDENDSVLDAEIKLCEAYTICSNSRETNESKRSPFNKDYDVRCKEKIPTKIFSKNDFKFSDRFDNKFNTSKVDEADEDMQKNLNSSSSLDILVGLLNEIKNISKCQAYIATNYDYGAKIMDDPHEDSHSLKTWNSNSTRSDFKNGSRTVSGVSTPDQKCSKSTENELTHQSYLSSIQKSKTQNNYPGDGLGFDSKCVSCDIIGQMEYIEKGINVQMGENGLVNVYVDTPPEGPAGEGEGEGGGARSSRLGARSRSSGGNALALKDLNKRTVHYHRSLIDINVASQPYTDTVIIYKKMGNAVNNATNIAENMKLSKEHQIIHIGKNDFEKTANPHTFGVDDCQGPDPLLKLKRDILVTMYSVFVFIVFAALSFSQIVYT